MLTRLKRLHSCICSQWRPLYEFLPFTPPHPTQGSICGNISHFCFSSLCSSIQPSHTSYFTPFMHSFLSTLDTRFLYQSLGLSFHSWHPSSPARCLTFSVHSSLATCLHPFSCLPPGRCIHPPLRGLHSLCVPPPLFPLRPCRLSVTDGLNVRRKKSLMPVAIQLPLPDLSPLVLHICFSSYRPSPSACYLCGFNCASFPAQAVQHCSRFWRVQAQTFPSVKLPMHTALTLLISPCIHCSFTPPFPFIYLFPSGVPFHSFLAFPCLNFCSLYSFCSLHPVRSPTQKSPFMPLSLS